MTTEGTIVDVDNIQSLSRHNEELQAHVKMLELQLVRKESEVRRATEEHNLRRELQTINQLTLRKQSAGDQSSLQGRIRISEDSLAQVIALEDRIKLETKRTQELQIHGQLVDAKLNDVEQNIMDKSNRIAVIKDATGWERDNCAAKGFENQTNRYRDHQRIVTQLEEKQRTIKGVLDKLTLKLEYLTSELEQRKEVEEEYTNAMMLFKSKQAEYNELIDRKKELQRILLKKDKMLKDTESKDDYKTIKQLEGEKRVLHNELGRLMESGLTNTKSIIAQEVRLRQLEIRLAAVDQFLSQILRVEDDEVLPDNVEAMATEVPVDTFDAIQRELAISRHTVVQRDAQLEAQDARVEQLERKVNILHCAIVTRTATAAQEAQEMEREYSLIAVHLDYMRTEFEQEHEKLMQEHEALQAKVRAQGGIVEEVN